MSKKRSPAKVRAEAGTEETRQFVRRVRRVTRRKFTPEEKDIGDQRLASLSAKMPQGWPRKRCASTPVDTDNILPSHNHSRVARLLSPSEATSQTKKATTSISFLFSSQARISKL